MWRHALSPFTTMGAEAKTSLPCFELERILYEDPRAKSVNLLGQCEHQGERVPALLLMEKTHFTPAFLASLQQGLEHTFSHLEQIGQNDIYTWVFGWTSDQVHTDAHTKMSLICPANSDLIAKYSAPERRMIIETPHMYETVTKPWIESLPASKVTWVHNILNGESERESVLYNDEDPKTGFVLVPDLKWDRRTLSSLYMVAIVRDGSLTNMRDLTKDHIPLLRKIQKAGAQIAHEKYGLPAPSADGSSSSLRCFLHYMPTYFHLHVHLMSANFTTHPGALVGQAQLVDDVISLLELGVDFRQRTIGYALADGHKLLAALQQAGFAT